VEIFDALFERTGEDAVRHLFMVASALDSMVVGEAQILSQVKQAYELARTTNNAGPLTNAAFQAAMRVAKRVANETAINQRRVSIPSVAVADFAKAIFEHFGDKRVLVISTTGAAEPILTAAAFRPIRQARHQRPLFMLDLAVPRDIEAAVGDFLGVYLYSIDDLSRLHRTIMHRNHYDLEAVIRAVIAYSTARP
jgi:glutamyl-tRNA reductase